MSDDRVNHVARFMPPMLAGVAAFLLLFTIWLIYTQLRPAAAFSYGQPAVMHSPLCIGDDLILAIDGHTRGRPNITKVAHAIYFETTSNLAKILPEPPLIAGGDFGPQSFVLTLNISTAGLSAGHYIYTRQAHQLPNSSITGFDVPFTIINCR